jgi:hypothetical protein
MAVRWACSICKDSSEYHLCIDGEHRYYCDKHWWEYVRNGYVVNTVVDCMGDNNKDVVMSGNSI